jgi:hypothetical protein
MNVSIDGIDCCLLRNLNSLGTEILGNLVVRVETITFYGIWKQIQDGCHVFEHKHA